MLYIPVTLLPFLAFCHVTGVVNIETIKVCWRHCVSFTAANGHCHLSIIFMLYTV